MNDPIIEMILFFFSKVFKLSAILIMLLYFLVFEEPEDPSNRSFFSEIISSISDVKFSNSGRYMISRDYLSVKVWDLHMETKPIECYPVRYSFLGLQFFFLTYKFYRSTSIYGRNYVRCMRMTAFLINLNVAGMGLTPVL